MKITRKICLLLVAFVVSQTMAAQSVLTGKVEDKSSGEPLAGASVFVQNKDERTLASVLVDANGEYRIRIPEGDNNSKLLKSPLKEPSRIRWVLPLVKNSAPYSA